MFGTRSHLANRQETAGANKCITEEFNFAFDFMTYVELKEKRIEFENKT